MSPFFDIYHCSPTRITKILKDNSWGDVDFSGCIFFALQPYALGSCDYLYRMELTDEDVIEVCFLDPAVLINTDNWSGTASEKIIRYASVYDINIDEEDAEDLLCENRAAFRILDGIEDPEARGYLEWYIQGIQGRAAHAMGYTVAQSRDEQGTVYIAYLHGKEHLLTLCEQDSDD